jgi:hypothetical protein
MRLDPELQFLEIIAENYGLKEAFLVADAHPAIFITIDVEPIQGLIDYLKEQDPDA